MRLLQPLAVTRRRVSYADADDCMILSVKTFAKALSSFKAFSVANRSSSDFDRRNGLYLRIGKVNKLAQHSSGRNLTLTERNLPERCGSA